jgi:hypothetical protein
MSQGTRTCFVKDPSVPHLRRFPDVKRNSRTYDDAIAGSSHKVTFELNRGMPLGTFRQAGDSAVSAAHISQRSDDGGMQKTVGCQMAFPNLYPPLDLVSLQGDDLNPQKLRQITVSQLIKISGVLVCFKNGFWSGWHRAQVSSVVDFKIVTPAAERLSDHTRRFAGIYNKTITYL